MRLFDLILYVQDKNFLVTSGWVFLIEKVLSKDKRVLLKDTTQWRQWGSNLRPRGLDSSTLQLSHCAPHKPYAIKRWSIVVPTKSDSDVNFVYNC